MYHIWIFDRAYFDLLRQKAAGFDCACLQSDDINIYATNITEKILSLSKECIPNKQVRIRPSEPVWMTSVIRNLIRKHKRAFRKAKLTDTSANWETFRKLRNKVISLIRESKKNRNEQLTNTVRIDKAITLLDAQNATLPNMLAYNGTILNRVKLRLSWLLSLPRGKTSGPDEINNRVLKALATKLSPEFTSLQQSDVPDIWKRSHMCPVSKGGDVSSLSVKRPLSLLSNIDKTFERIVFMHLYNHFHDNDIIPLQSGFIPGTSTVNQLTFFYDTICKVLDSGKEVRVVFCDISKAFDCVWHSGLIHKLRASDVSGNLLTWFENY